MVTCNHKFNQIEPNDITIAYVWLKSPLSQNCPFPKIVTDEWLEPGAWVWVNIS